MTTTPEPGDKLPNTGSVVIVNFSESIMHTRQLASAPDRPPTYVYKLLFYAWKWWSNSGSWHGQTLCMVYKASGEQHIIIGGHAHFIIQNSRYNVCLEKGVDTDCGQRILQNVTHGNSQPNPNLHISKHKILNV